MPPAAPVRLRASNSLVSVIDIDMTIGDDIIMDELDMPRADDILAAVFEVDDKDKVGDMKPPNPPPLPLPPLSPPISPLVCVEFMVMDMAEDTFEFGGRGWGYSSSRSMHMRPAATDRAPLSSRRIKLARRLLRGRRVKRTKQRRGKELRMCVRWSMMGKSMTGERDIKRHFIA